MERGEPRGTFVSAQKENTRKQQGDILSFQTLAGCKYLESNGQFK